MHVLHRFAKEEVIHRHVCTFLYALISHTPSKDAIAVLGCLTELSLPLLDTSVCVESTCGDLSKGMTTFIRNNHLQAIAIEFLTTFLVSSTVECIDIYTIVQGQIKAKLGGIFGIFTCEPGEYIYTHLFIFIM